MYNELELSRNNILKFENLVAELKDVHRCLDCEFGNVVEAERHLQAWRAGVLADLKHVARERRYDAWITNLNSFAEVT